MNQVNQKMHALNLCFSVGQISMEDTASALEALEEGLSGRFNHEELTKLSEAGFCSEKDFRDAIEKDLSNLVRAARLGDLSEHLKVAGNYHILIQYMSFNGQGLACCKQPSIHYIPVQ